MEIQAQAIINSLTRQVSEYAGKVALLEAQIEAMQNAQQAEVVVSDGE